ncbi:MAG TPA: tetratricopeptide repeat protein [Candidatus Dormibacteraeota bacterium]|nr:tetratricopeptide repeat protein [Candidatus Dormibacteraeota bacterium]
MPIFSTFSPSAMPADLIEGTFVQRQALAERLVDIFELSARTAAKHNVLLVGPRGIGKSHLLSVVYHRLKNREDLADKLCIAYLREDEWGLNSFLDLLLRVWRAACEEAKLECSDNIAALKASSPEATEQVWNRLRSLLGNRTLLLIVENLDAVFEGIGEQGQRQWRALIQTHPQWAILATTPALFTAISRQVSPFYGFFEVIHLSPLSFEEAITLLQRLAKLNNDSETETFLGTASGRARVRAVQHLAGGNHRIFVLFYDFLNQSRSEPLVVPLLKTIDALTPYYQSQMARLSLQQRKIVNFLCEHQTPATVTAIANSCLTTHQTAANQLKHLLGQRYVRVDRVGREAFYELAEPLMRICVEAKTHHERPLDLLVDFIRYWFSREELRQKLSHTGDRDPSRNYFAAALRGYDAHDAHNHLDTPIAELCVALTLGKDTPERLQDKARELAQLSKIAEDWDHYTRAVIRSGEWDDAVPMLEEALAREPNNTDVLRSLGLLYRVSGSIERAQGALDRAIALRPRSAALLLDQAQLFLQQKQNEQALKACEEAAELDPDAASFSAVMCARILVAMAQFEAARQRLTPFVSQGYAVPSLFSIYGVTFFSEEKFQDALEYFDKAVRANEFDSEAWGNRAIVLCKLKRYDEALESVDRATELGAESKFLPYTRCQSLLKLGQYELAVKSATPEELSHCIFHLMQDLLTLHPKQGRLQQDLWTLSKASDSHAWQDAFLGGLTEFANAMKDFESEEELKDLSTWNMALNELFAGQERFSILLNFLDVLTRVKVFDDRKALLGLPREQRLLIIGEKREEDFLNRSEG